jgi:peptidyl-prolyl cis-trans isomerase D
VIPGLSDGAGLLGQAFAVVKGADPASASTGDGFAVFQVTDIKPAHAPEFAEYKAHILEDYREQQVPQLLNAELKKLDDRAKVLNDLKKAAAEMNLSMKTSDLVSKDAQVPDLGTMSGPGSVAFSLAKGAISGPINTGRSGVVLSVVDKQEPTADDIAKNFNATREKLLNEQHEEIFRVYIGELTQKYEKGGAVKYSQKQPATPSSPFGN